MAELKTRIILRNGTTAEWATSEVLLRKGEIALEYCADGTVKQKAGSDETGKKFSELPYIGSDVKAANVFQVELDADDTDDIAAIEAKVIAEGAKKQAGDVAICKGTFADGKVSYTSYVYDPELDVEGEDSSHGWSAMDGNYSASNVFLKNDITLTSAVGNYAKDYTIDAGTSLEALLSGLLQKEEEPATPSKPSASISASGGSGEVGTEYTVPTATLNIGSVGSYTYGPATGIVFNAGDVKLAEGADPAAATNYVVNESNISTTGNKLTLKATGDKVKYTDSAVKYIFSGSASYQAATASPVTNLGNPSKTQSAISAGSCTITDKEVSFTGWRRMYMGAVAADAAIDSATIKGIGTATTTNVISEQASKNVKTFTAPVGTAKILIAYPRTTSTKAPKVEYFTMSWESFGDFALAAEKVKVADASGAFLADTATADEYMVYAYAPADPLKADTQFRVTLQ